MTIQKPESGDDAPRDGSEMTYSCIDSAVFVLIMKLLTCYNYSYVLSTISCLTIDTIVTLFLFISRRVPISIYLFINRRAPIFIDLSQSTYFYLFIAVYGTAS